MSKTKDLTKRLEKAAEAMAISQLTALMQLVYEDLQTVKQKMLREEGINPTAVYLTKEVSVLISMRPRDVVQLAKSGKMACCNAEIVKGQKLRFLGKHVLAYLELGQTGKVIELERDLAATG